MSDYTFFKVTPMTIGAELSDFTQDPATHEGTRAELYRAWLEFGLIKLSNIDSIETHLAVSSAFGELELHPLVHMRAPEHELFMAIGSEIGKPYVYDDQEIKIGTIPWHRDTAYEPNLANGAMLRILETPEKGGETWFADTAKAWDDLPQHLQERLEQLEWVGVLKNGPFAQSGPGAIWKSVRELTEEEWENSGLVRAEREKASAGTRPRVAHPAMITHPESKRKCIFLSPKEFEFFIGLDKEESDALFKEICDHMLQDKYVYKQHWKVNDVMGWDNRRMMHAAYGAFVGDRRKGLRTTLAGDFSAGYYYDEVPAGTTVGGDEGMM